MVLHPDEARDGHAGAADGFAYRMLYVDPGAISAALGDVPPPFVPDAVALRAVARAREFLVAEAPRTIASEELESVSGLDRFALARHFRAAFGTSPHRFQVGRRLGRARTMIAGGTPLSEVAAATGFADQSHLTRHFSARFGLTPGRWAALSRASA